MNTEDAGKHILVLAYGNADETSANKHRIIMITDTLIEIGYHVTLLWFYPVNRIWKKRYFGSLKGRARAVIACPAPPLYRFKRIAKFSRSLCSYIASLIMKTFKANVIHAETAVCGTFIATPQAGSLRVLDMHGDFPAELEMVNAPPWRIALALDDEKRALVSATGSIFVTAHLHNYLLEKHKSNFNMAAVVPCAVDLDKFKLSESVRKIVRKKLNLDGRKVFCYAGGLAAWQSIDQMLDLIINMRKKDPTIYLLFLTNGNIETYKHKLDLIGVAELDYRTMTVNNSEVCGYLNASDFGLLLRSNNPVNLVASPTKLGEYLASGLPVVTTKYAGNAPIIISETGCGYVLNNIVVDDEELQRLLDFTDKIMANRSAIADECYSVAVRHLSLATAKKNIMSFYKNIFEMQKREL